MAHGIEILNWEAPHGLLANLQIQLLMVMVTASICVNFTISTETPTCLRPLKWACEQGLECISFHTYSTTLINYLRAP